MGKLYVVGTPIGNLGDISARALETLQQVDFIAAEDTRVSLKLLSHFDIRKSMVSYHEHNARDMGEKITARIINGENCAIITDAGMPCISDPGEQLVCLCAEKGIPVVVIPGPSAVIAAVAVSGLATGRFSFEGFLNANKSERRERLQQLARDERTLVFYEAPHKLTATLCDMLELWGDRRITLARELTKLHEEIIRTTLSEAAGRYDKDENRPRGEFVLVIEGAPPAPEDKISFAEAVELVKSMHSKGTGVSQAAKEIARDTGYKKGDLYREALKD